MIDLEIKIKKPLIGIYKITNLLDSKVYIGQARNIKERWQCHLNNLTNNRHCNNHLQNAWNKYGAENFKFEIIEECEESELNEREIYWIDYYGGCNSNNNYNLMAGGNCGGSPSIETRQKLSIKNKGQKRSQEFSKRLREVNLGKHHSEETKKKIGLGGLGRIPWNKNKPITEEHKQKISKANSGRIRSEEAKQKTSNTMKGIPKSEETKQKMRKPKSPKAIENMKKAQQNRVWINNGIINKKIKKDELDKYLTEGFVLGVLIKNKQYESL